MIAAIKNWENDPFLSQRVTEKCQRNWAFDLASLMFWAHSCAPYGSLFLSPKYYRRVAKVLRQQIPFSEVERLYEALPA
jgi:hypothetical protein